MNPKQDTTELLLDEVCRLALRFDQDSGAYQDDCEYVLDVVQRLRAHCYRLGQHAPVAAPADHAGEQRWFRDLLAVIHRDGGHHTEKVGTEQSAVDATRIASGLLRTIDELQIELAGVRDEIAVLRAKRKAKS